MSFLLLTMFKTYGWSGVGWGGGLNRLAEVSLMGWKFSCTLTITVNTSLHFGLWTLACQLEISILKPKHLVKECC